MAFTVRSKCQMKHLLLAECLCVYAQTQIAAHVCQSLEVVLTEPVGLKLPEWFRDSQVKHLAGIAIQTSWSLVTNAAPCLLQDLEAQSCNARLLRNYPCCPCQYPPLLGCFHQWFRAKFLFIWFHLYSSELTVLTDVPFLMQYLLKKMFF